MATTMCARNISNIAKLICCVKRFRLRDNTNRMCSIISNNIWSNVLTSNTVNNSSNYVLLRKFSSSNVRRNGMSDIEIKKGIELLTEKFTEARELIEDARESQGTVYFSDDMSEAQEAVKQTLEEYSQLLSRLSDSQRQDVMRTIGLRMEELKAQHEALEETLKD